MIASTSPMLNRHHTAGHSLMLLVVSAATKGPATYENSVKRQLPISAGNRKAVSNVRRWKAANNARRVSSLTRVRRPDTSHHSGAMEAAK